MSFSGIKTAFRELVRRGEAAEPGFIQRELAHLCAALQHTIVELLLQRLRQAAREQGIPRVAIAGGVSANSALRDGLKRMGAEEGWEVFIPPFVYCTDNAAMIAMAGHFLHLAGEHAELDVVPFARG